MRILTLLLTLAICLPPATAVAPPSCLLWVKRVDTMGTGKPILLPLAPGSHKGTLHIWQGKRLKEVREVESPDMPTLGRHLRIETEPGERLRVVVIGGIRIPR